MAHSPSSVSLSKDTCKTAAGLAARVSTLMPTARAGFPGFFVRGGVCGAPTAWPHAPPARSPGLERLPHCISSTWSVAGLWQGLHKSLPKNRSAPPEENCRTFMPNQRRDKEAFVKIYEALEKSRQAKGFERSVLTGRQRWLPAGGCLSAWETRQAGAEAFRSSGCCADLDILHAFRVALICGGLHCRWGDVWWLRGCVVVWSLHGSGMEVVW